MTNVSQSTLRNAAARRQRRAHAYSLHSMQAEQRYPPMLLLADTVRRHARVA
jgi:hypothetical protein